MCGVTHRIEGHLNKSVLLREGTNIHLKGYQNRMKFSLCECVSCICSSCGSVGFAIACEKIPVIVEASLDLGAD